LKRVEFRILGPLEAVAADERLRLGGPKQRALLALLLLRRNEVVPRERLVDAIWGEEPPASASNSLQVYVHGLRRVLGAERIERNGSGYRISVEPDELDLERFERLVRRATEALGARPGDAAEDLREALALWRGEPLADLADEPVAAEAGGLEELRVGALELRNDAELASGRHEELVPQLAALVAEHPYRERLREQLILALYRCGRQKDALDAYRAARETFVEELGVEPGPALQELERAVLRQETELDAPVQRAAIATKLPTPATPLVGRRMETAAVAALLRDDARLVTLTGPGGTGKTRLALAVAEELAPDLRDGAVFVDLAPLADPELIVPTIAAALGIADEASVADELHDRSLLLVLDNLEQLLDGVAAIGSLLARASRLRVLATSRSALQLYGEHEYPVPPLELPATGAAFEALAANDAVRLFAARARAVDPAFVLDDTSIGAVAAICRRLDGLPLAIELAAARTRHLPLESILERLAESLDLLSGGARDAHPRQRALRATLDWSFDALAPDEQRTFGALGAFAGGFTEPLARTVAGGDPFPLVEQSLVRRTRDRFVLLEPIRAYALERLRESAEEHDVRQRHLQALLHYAQMQNARIVEGVDVEAAYHGLGVEHDNLRAALDFAEATGNVEAQVALAVALRQFWLVRGHVVEGRSRFDSAVAAVPEDGGSLRGAALVHGASFAYRQSDLATAKAWFGEALELFRALDEPSEVGRCLGELGSVALGEGDVDRAQALYEESAEVFERENVPVRLGVVLANLGAIATLRGELDAAAAYAERAAALQRQTGDADGLSVTRHNYARILMGLGRVDEARASLRESIELARGIDYQEVLAYCLETSGELAFARGERESSARLLGASVAAFERLGIAMAAEEAEGYARVMDELRAELGSATVEELHALGGSASFGESVSSALELLRADSAAA
jgi:predicted ATPase/DNA-binding SARP family transcriptional activator